MPPSVQGLLALSHDPVPRTSQIRTIRYDTKRGVSSSAGQLWCARARPSLQSLTAAARSLPTLGARIP